MSHDRGRFAWYDLLTTDLEAAQTFYKSVVGWDTQPFDGPKPYIMWTADGKPMGGVMALPEAAQKMGAPPHWMAYVTVDDVDAAVAQVPDLGGKVYHAPFDVPNVGRIAVIADPSGAAISLFKPQQAMEGTPDTNANGQVSWNELATSVPDKSWAFYQKLFGWEKTQAMDMGPMGTYQLFGHGDKSHGGYLKKPEQMPVSAWIHYIRVPNLSQAIERVNAGGGKIVHGPMPVPGDDFIAQGLDPQGGFFALVSRTQ